MITQTLNGIAGGDSRLDCFSRLAAWLAVSIFLAGMSAVPASAQSSDDEVEEMPEIVVRGTQASLKRSLDIKREATAVVDSIVAEDIGKFPDLNLSESLQRVTGVTVDRGVSGEGNTISLRGLPPELTRVTLNGMTAATGAQGREFDFDVFSSELFSSVLVTKTPSAALTEGGLAGTIDLSIPSASEAGDILGFSVGGQYADLGDGDTHPRLFGIFSRSFDDGRFGFIGSASYSESFIRGDTSEGFRWESLSSRTQLDERVNAAVTNGTPVPTVRIDGVDVNDAATLLEIANRVNTAILVRDQLWSLDRERLGVTAGFEFNPNDIATYKIDLMYARMDEIGDRHIYGGSPGFSGNIVMPTALTIVEDYAIQASFDPLARQLTSQQNQIETDFFHSTIGGDIALSDDTTVRLRGGFSKATETLTLIDYSYVSVGLFDYDMSNRHYPAFSSPGLDLFDATEWSPSLAQARVTDVEDEVIEVRGDLERNFYSELQAIKVGLEYRTRQKTRENFDGRLAIPDIAPWVDVVSSGGFPVDDFLSDAPGGSRGNFPTIDFGRAEAENLPQSFINSIPAVSNAFYDVTEDIVGAYIQADLSFELADRPLDMNLGFRVANTRQTSKGFLIAGGVTSPVTVNQDYTDVLPSLNARWTLTDDLILRFAANRAITRPTLSQLGPGTTAFGTSLNGTAGNPELDPFRADQIDFSIEWYFSDEGLLAATIFHKDVESFIVTANVDRVVVGPGLFDGAGNDVSGSVFSIRTPLNGVGGYTQGVEISYQQPFEFLEGFGLLANATFADSEGTLDFGGGNVFKERLQNQSDISYNLIAYYETGPFSARAAFAHRGDYGFQYRGIRPNGELWSFIFEDRNQLDLAVRLDVGEHTSIYLDAINITGEDAYLYDTNPYLNARFEDQGAVYNFGVRIKF